jgi:phage terminase large subunit-like protein
VPAPDLSALFASADPLAASIRRAVSEGLRRSGAGAAGGPELPPYNPGPQTLFRDSGADIAFYGGAAGGGKSWALLVEPLKHVRSPDFGAVIFRRELTRITAEGGLWDEAMGLYPAFGGEPRQSPRFEFEFPGGAGVQFGHLEHEKSKLSWQGAQIALLLFDQVEELSASQFWFMQSRNRSVRGLRCYTRCTFNPAAVGEPGYWVNDFLRWWWDPETGLPIPERSGVLRWFVRVEDEFSWADSAEELVDRHRCPPEDPISVTFIPARLGDNPKMVEADPRYGSRLRSMDYADRQRLEGGNFLVSERGGGIVQRWWFPIIRDPAEQPVADTGKPVGDSIYSLQVRAWDLAGTEGGGDETSGVLGGRVRETGRVVIRHEVRFQEEPGATLQRVIGTILYGSEGRGPDGPGVVVSLRIDPGQAGKHQAQVYTDAIRKACAAEGVAPPRIVLRAYRAGGGDKLERSKPFRAAAAPAYEGRLSPETGVRVGAVYGTVDVAAGPWADRLVSALHHFTGRDGGRDDTMDACSDMYTALYDPEILGGGAFAWRAKRR